MEGLGPLSFEAQRGMYLHPTYAVTPDREPLGLLDAWMWAREPLDENGRRSGINESTRWIESYERVAKQAATLPDTRLVYVADRESDIAALVERADAGGVAADDEPTDARPGCHSASPTTQFQRQQCTGRWFASINAP